MAKELKRTKAPSGGANNPQEQFKSPNLSPRAKTRTKVTAPKEEGGIFRDIFNVILKLKNRDKSVDQAIDDALNGKTQ